MQSFNKLLLARARPALQACLGPSITATTCGARHALQARQIAHDQQDVEAQSSTSVEEKLKKMERHLYMDIHAHILASPLRTCRISYAKLPSALMFRLETFRPAGSRKMPDSLRMGHDREMRELRNRAIRKHPLRWYRREAKRTHLKILSRTMRMLKHKVATSQTDASRQHFEQQLASVKAQLGDHNRPPRRGFLHPTGVTLDKTRNTLDDVKEGTLVPSAPRIWCTLHPDLARRLNEKNYEKLVPGALPPRHDIVAVLDEQLEQRVLDEARKLKARVDPMQAVEASSTGWLVRRRALQSASASPDVTGASRHEEQRDSMVSEGLITDAKIFAELQVIFQHIAKVLGRKAHREHKRVKREVAAPQAKAEHVSQTQPSADKEHKKRGPKSEESKTLASLYQIRPHAKTLELRLALWRLSVWRSAKIDASQGDREEGEEKQMEHDEEMLTRSES